MAIEYTLYMEPALIGDELGQALEQAGFTRHADDASVYLTDSCHALVGVAVDHAQVKERAFGFDPGSSTTFTVGKNEHYRPGVQDMARGVAATLSTLPDAEAALVSNDQVLLRRRGGRLTYSDRDHWHTNAYEGLDAILPKPDAVAPLPMLG